MTGTNPIAEQPYIVEGSTATPWTEARERLEQADSWWLATVQPNGHPHVVPVLAVWADGVLHFAASANSRKARNLMHNSQCVITTSARDLDLVIEGEATKVENDTRLQHVAAVYASKYDWHVEVRDGVFHAEGAPTAGPPPFDVYQITATKAFGFPTGGSLTPTRWRF